eukprot:scaffold90368_cov15-Tisochrysis_lutea.AAC.1
MLRAYIAPHQTDWDEHLVAAEFAYNDSVQASTDFNQAYLEQKALYTEHETDRENMLIKTGEMQNLL